MTRISATMWGYCYILGDIGDSFRKEVGETIVMWEMMPGHPSVWEGVKPVVFLLSTTTSKSAFAEGSLSSPRTHFPAFSVFKLRPQLTTLSKKKPR